MDKNKISEKKAFLSTAELATLMGVSRIAVFKKIKTGEIKAEKVGRNYIIPFSEFESAVGKFVSENQKEKIEEIVKRTVSQYGEVLRRLGKE